MKRGFFNGFAGVIQKRIGLSSKKFADFVNRLNGHSSKLSFNWDGKANK